MPERLRVLVACEYSGVVRDAFRRMGHDAMSCDLLPTDAPGPHYEGDVRDVLDDGGDLMVAHLGTALPELVAKVRDYDHVFELKEIYHEQWLLTEALVQRIRAWVDAPPLCADHGHTRDNECRECHVAWAVYEHDVRILKMIDEA